MFFEKRLRNTLLATVSASSLIVGTNAFANPEGAVVVSGDVSIDGVGTNNVVIQNNSNRAIVNFDSFSIGVGETTTINQVSNDAAILNRVVGNNPSEIFGTLRSNGQVFLINESGILVGESGIIETNGFVASTLDISNDDFLNAGELLFKQGVDVGGGIEVHGKIRSVTGGDIFLLSREITIGETAEIKSDGGYVGLGAGEEILLRPVDTGDGRISIRAGKGKIINRGHIEAVSTELKAAGGNEYALAINNTGVVRATGFSKSGGKIRLGAGGKIRNSGKLVARKKVVVRSKKKIINKGLIKAGDGNKGGEIIFEAPEIQIEADSVLDVSGALGGGRIFVGGGFQGSTADRDGNEIGITETALNVTVDSGAVLMADATESGDGGDIILWAEDTTFFGGEISARGGSESGDGGFVETSGKQDLIFRGNVDTSAANGERGQLLLDPTNILVVAAAPGADDGEVADNIIAAGDGGAANFTISDDVLEAQLANNDVFIAATNDITFDAGVRINWTNDGTGANNNALFTVTADNDINALDDVIIQNAGSGGDITTDEGGIMFITTGGDINIGSSGTRTGRVAIGSEYGVTELTASGGTINIIAGGNDGAGGNASGASAHVGFEQGTTRGGTQGNITNGSITVGANEDVNITSVNADPTISLGDGNFARIGHGGAFESVSGSNNVAEISGNITVNVGISLTLLGAETQQLDAVDSANGSVLNSASIGHGSNVQNTDLANDRVFTQGNISGQISVDVGNTLNINGNTQRSEVGDGINPDNILLARIGHGSNIAIDRAGSNGNTVISTGQIQGEIDVEVGGSLSIGDSVLISDTEVDVDVVSTIGHGAAVTGTNGLLGVAVSDHSITINHGSIIGFNALGVADSEQSTDINVSAGSTNIISGTQNNRPTGSPSNITDFVNSSVRSQIGHSPVTILAPEETSNAIVADGSADITVIENRISGDISITDTDNTDDAGVHLSSNIVGTTDNTTRTDYATSRIGHAGLQMVEGRRGVLTTIGAVTTPQNAADISIFQAHILGADITVDTTAGGANTAADNQDVILTSSVSAGNTQVLDSTAVTQIGHGSDTLVQTGDGGDSTGSGALSREDLNASDGGDITVARGTVWDGGLTRDDDLDTTDSISIPNTTNITIRSSNEIIVDSDTASSANAQTNRSNSEAQIGHGFKIRLDTGDGGTSSNAGAAGGAGGDVLIYQAVDAREYGIDQNDNTDAMNSGVGAFDDYATGIRGDITLSATALTGATSDSGFAVTVTANDTSSTQPTNFNSDYATIGHGDVIEITTGDGGDGSAGRDFEGDVNDPANTGATGYDPTGQVSVAGGRGGHIDVQLGRAENVGDSTSQALLGSLIFDNRGQASNGQNQADIGDSRAIDLAVDGAGANIARANRQGVSLTEGDISIVANGRVNVAGQITNANAASNNALVEANIGHATRIFGDSGDGGDAGSGNFHSQTQTVFESEQTGEEFLNYASSTGSNRGGNGGDVRITHGDVTDRAFVDEDGAGPGGFVVIHDTDADATEVGPVNEGRSNITFQIFDESGGVTQDTGGDSLIVESTITQGNSENNGDINSGVGHRVRLFAEAGAGGEGGSTNTEFDADGNSLFTNGAGQEDTQTGAGDLDPGMAVLDDEEDGFDETAAQAGAVFNQPNASGGRGGDALVINNNISGAVVVNAARRVTVDAGDGNGGDTKIFASIGHTTDIVALTQAGGDAGDLIEEDPANATFDGGIINVGGGQNNDNSANDANAGLAGNQTGGTFAHVFIDGNQDDQFNLENLGGANSTEGEDGVAVTPEDIDNRTGSTFTSINGSFGTLTQATTGASDGNGNNSDGIATFVTNGDGNNVIFHDEEADPNFILDGDGTFVLNNEANNAAYVGSSTAPATNAGAAAANLARFGRVVAAYDGEDAQPDSQNFFDTGTPGGNPFDGSISLEVFVDTDLDGDVDLVDFDRDGRIDIVDVDRDGIHDVIDGRANYVDITGGTIGGANDDTQNGITGLGVLDYVAVTGVTLDEAAASNSGEIWSNQRELNSTNLLAQYNDSSSTQSDFTAFVSDFATANGGRGGDAYTQVGYSIGDVSVSTGNNDLGEADSLVIATNIADATSASAPNDTLRATIGHSAFQVSDSGLFYAEYRAGREGIVNETDVRTEGANGGNAGNFAVNGNGGRGGNSAAVQGAIRDLDADLATVNTEFDHLVGRIFINTPNTFDTSSSTDSGLISITSNIAGDTSPGDNNLLSVVGHSTLAGAFATNTGGNGASDPGGENGSSQTEIADGGDGGDAGILQRQIKGSIEVRTASDDLDGSNDFSLQILVDHGHPSGGDNLAISGIGHERQAFVNTTTLSGLDTSDTGGQGGEGDDGQFRGNGGAGGDAFIIQEDIIDANITVDLVVPIFDGGGSLQDSYDGNGALIRVTDNTAADDILRAQIGNADLAFAVSGNGGNGATAFNVSEQRNQTENGGDGGDAVINQAGYNNDITLDIGSNESFNGADALQIVTTGGINNGANDHLLAVVGHGGFGEAVSGDGGDAGLNGNITGIPAAADPNLVDSDFNYAGPQTQGDTPFAIDIANETDDSADVAGDATVTATTTANAATRGNAIVLGTTRRGGNAGDAIVNLGVGGTGANESNREDLNAQGNQNNDFGINDTNGADITITTNDLFDTTPATTTQTIAEGNDGILIQAGTLPGSNQDSSLFLNAALAGHHSFAEATSGDGGDGIQSALSAQISDGDGGDGGEATATSGAIRGDVSLSNVVNTAGQNNNNSTAVELLDADIAIQTISTTASDNINHRADARVGHLTQLEATTGVGGDASKEVGVEPNFPASISAQGGDGGDATTFQGQLEGDISVEAENSVDVFANDTTTGNGAGTAAVGHRTVGEATAAIGGLGGTYNGDSQDQSAYFTYEALREFHARRTGGIPDGAGGTTAAQSDSAAFAALSEFEQKLVAPVTDYFENKPGELEVFLDSLVGDSIAVIANNERDDDFVNNTDFTIPSLITGTGHIDGADDGEIETLSAILAASGHGGNATVVQGSLGLSGTGPELSANGDINIVANAFSDDSTRGIDIRAEAGTDGVSFQQAHVGHQSEAHQVTAGNGQQVNPANAGANGIGGDGGDAIVDQYAHNGGINLVSNNVIRVAATDSSLAAHEVRAQVGHRLTVGNDYTTFRETNSVTAGNGGNKPASQFDDGHLGNGGDVFIYQRNVVSGRTENTLTFDTEISMAALQDSEAATPSTGDASIQIQAQATGNSAPDVETHIGHDNLIHAVKAGDAGILVVPISAVNGASEGLLEGNGGDIFIVQTDLGADIDIVGRDDINIESTTSTSGSNHSNLLIGHERTIGNSANTTHSEDGAIMDNPRTGTIIAGQGGLTDIEDVNGTALDSREAAAAGIIEDGDSGRIEIALGILGDSFENDGAGNDADERQITIISLTEDVNITASSTLGANAVLEIGNQQQVIAETLSASEFTGTPTSQTAGDVGGIFINRDTIFGDILIQAIDADRASSQVAANGKAVNINSTAVEGANAILQIGHETDFTATTGTPQTARAAFGESREFLADVNLSNFVALDPADTNANTAATLRDAQNAVEDMEDLARALGLALENADRFPANDSGNTNIAGLSAQLDNFENLTVAERTTLQNDIEALSEALIPASDQSELFAEYLLARFELAEARSNLNSIGSIVPGAASTLNEAEAVINIQGNAANFIGNIDNFEAILDAGIVPNASNQIGDFAEGGDIVYGALDAIIADGTNQLNSHTSSISQVDALNLTTERTLSIGAGGATAGNGAGTGANLVAEGFAVTDTGEVRGNVDILSGRDNDLGMTDLTSVAAVIGNDDILVNDFTGDGNGDTIDDSVVNITTGGGLGTLSLIELGHRRFMVNTTNIGGGDTDGAPEASGPDAAGDGGSIITRNTTSGDVNIRAEEVIIRATGGSGLESEVHLLHSAFTNNTTGFSDIQTLLGNGGDIINTTSVSGGVNISAEHLASDLNAGDRKLLANGAANSLLHFGHQVEDINESQSDPNETGNNGDTQDNLGSNRGGFIVSSQTVGGNTAGDLVSISLDAAGDGNASDLVIETGGSGDSDIRLGNGEDGTGQGIRNEGISGANQSDDGSTVTLTQNISGDIEINTIEDLEINNLSINGDASIHVGHDGTQFGQSGQVNNPPTILQYGERVIVSQTITGNVNIATSSSFVADLGVDANELHIGHEGTQTAFAADDSANPSDFEDRLINATGAVGQDGIADGTAGAEGPSAAGVNDNFDQPDILATQTIEAGISIVTGEISLNNGGSGGRLHVGHEAFIANAVDGDLTDNFDGTNSAVTGTSVAMGSTGHVVSTSVINGSGSDIIFQATGVATTNDTVVDPSMRTNNNTLNHNVNGDIQLTALLGSDIQVGHRSTSTQTDGPLNNEGQYNTTQAIGSSTLNADGTEVEDTTQSVVSFDAAQDIILSSVTGETQVGHYIVELGTLQTNAANVDGDATTGLAAGDSELRQIVGSDIIFGDNTNQGIGGVGTAGAGNNLIIETGTGTTLVGHQSPDTNQLQVEDNARSVTVQLLDGDITAEAGTDAGVDAPDGTLLADAAAAIADETGNGDDILIQSGGGVARIGHNIAGGFGGGANETQRAAGDISVRSGGDLHILGGQIGHENYDTDVAVAGGMTITTSTPESLASATPIRDRIRGNTTIGAGQNSALEDSMLQTDVLLIDSAPRVVTINSGYGGIGNADVDGELRFFLPAQEGLTIATAPAIFNDSNSNGDATVVRTGLADTIFMDAPSADGNDHEHFFELFSETATYSDLVIGAGNFGFYFEPAPVEAGAAAVDPEFTIESEFTPPLFPEINPGFEIIFFDEETGTRTAVNTGGLDEFLGTSSMEIACEEQGLTEEECAEIAEKQRGIQPGLGSNTGFSGQAGGNSDDFVLLLDEEDVEGGLDTFAFTLDTQVTNTVTTFSPTPVTAPINDVTFSTPSFVTDEVVVKHTESFIGTTANNEYVPTDIENTYGSYVSADGAEEQINAAYPGALSYASSYLIYQENKLN